MEVAPVLSSQRLKPFTAVSGTVTVDKAGADIEVKLDGELPAQGFFRAKVEE